MTDTHSEEAEIAVLGCLMLYQTEAAELLSKCHDDYFFWHSRLYGLISSRMTEGKPCDFTSLIIADSELKQYGLMDWVENAPSIKVAMAYCDTLSELRAKRQLRLLSDSIIEQMNAGASIDEISQYSMDTLVNLKVKKNETVRSLREILRSIVKKVKERFESDEEPFIPTGFEAIDNNWGGLPPVMVTLSGVSGTGKSALMVTLTKRMIQDDAFNKFGPIVVFSQEMSDESLVFRLLADYAEITVQDMNRGKISNQGDRDQWLDFGNAVSTVDKFDGRLIIDCEPSVTPAHIRSRLHSIMLKYGKIGGVMVDYFTLMKIAENTKNKDDGHAINANAMLEMVKQFQCPFVVLAQFNKDVDKYKKKPSKGDVDFGKQLINNTHVSLVLYKNDTMEMTNMVELICDKARDLSTFVVRLKTDLKYNRMRQCTGDEERDYQEMQKQQQTSGFGGLKA